MPVSEIDEILINLKVLESLEINKKLITRDTYLNVEPNKTIPEFIRRWWRQDDRNETLRKIDDVIEKALRLRKEKDKSEVLDPYLINSIKGLRNLKQTYSLCVQTCARLDTIISKINRNINIICESSSDLDE
tara:strand:+ start:1520 stop:1915 length:396 start_codon:yes stop_codon:yes gene_type:complete